ncbi:MAG: hypothetical protein ACPGPS_14440 [Rubripirellula sp.]
MVSSNQAAVVGFPSHPPTQDAGECTLQLNATQAGLEGYANMFGQFW